jgi:hypothetical protein
LVAVPAFSDRAYSEPRPQNRALLLLIVELEQRVTGSGTEPPPTGVRPGAPWTQQLKAPQAVVQHSRAMDFPMTTPNDYGTPSAAMNK